jgi:hypothetical protein
MKGFNKILKNRIKHLPQYEPRTGTWDSILVQLKFRKKLSASVRHLPIAEPSEVIWSNIENSLNEGQSVCITHKTRNLAIALSAAASIALLIGVYFMYQNRTQGSITVSEEIVYEWDGLVDSGDDYTTQKGIQFIEEQCRHNTYVCSMPEFSEKKQQLDEINDQIKEIDEMIYSTGSTPTIIKSRIKLENMRTRLMKDLINQIAS